MTGKRNFQLNKIDGINDGSKHDKIELEKVKRQLETALHFEQMANEEVEALKAAIVQKKKELMEVQELMRQQGYALRQTRLSTCGFWVGLGWDVRRWIEGNRWRETERGRER